MTNQPAPRLTVEEIHAVVCCWAAKAWCNTDRLAADLHALITEHVRTVLEAERGKAATPVTIGEAADHYDAAWKDWRELPESGLANKQEAFRSGYGAALELRPYTPDEVRTLTEQRDKAVEGLKTIENGLHEVIGDDGEPFEMTMDAEDMQEIARSTIAAIEGEGHDHA